jgi:hypothetical protein
MERLDGGICGDGIDGPSFRRRLGFGRELIGGRSGVLLVLAGGIRMFEMALGIFEFE